MAVPAEPCMGVVKIESTVFYYYCDASVCERASTALVMPCGSGALRFSAVLTAWVWLSLLLYICLFNCEILLVCLCDTPSQFDSVTPLYLNTGTM